MSTVNGSEAVKVAVHSPLLRGLQGADLLQIVATVYVGRAEYRVYAPPNVSGDPRNWIEQLEVREWTTGSESWMQAEQKTDETHRSMIIQHLTVELERMDHRAELASSDPEEQYFHVRLRCKDGPEIETKLDVRRVELEDRVLRPYRAGHPIVLGGRTVPLDQLERIEIFATPYPSSEFSDHVAPLFRQGGRDCFYLQRGVIDVTDQLITTPAAADIHVAEDPVALICHRVHTVARQLRERHANRPTLDVTDEYDVQDLLHALLRIFVEDVRKEEWTPSYAGSSGRMDFLLPAQRTVIEVKKTRPGLGAKEVGQQLNDDIARYRTHPQCKRLVCFVYDPDGRVANPRGIEADLSKREPDFEVVVIIAPRE